MLDEYGKAINGIMVDIYNSIRRVESNTLKNTKLELSISELNIIETIGLYEERGCSISNIAQDMRVSLPNITVAVKRLESKGYVEKLRSEADGRMVRIALTRSGKRANAVHQYFHEQAVRAMLKGLDGNSRAVLMQAMRNLNGFLIQNS